MANTNAPGDRNEFVRVPRGCVRELAGDGEAGEGESAFA